MTVRNAATFLLFAVLFGWRVEETRIGSGYLDPAGKIQAQDEAVYSSAAIRMAEHGGWMTPMFMDRFFLYKPPLVYWMAGVTSKVLGISNLSLRLPSIVAAALICTIVAHHGGWVAVALVAANPLFFTLARRNMTDALLCAAIVVAVAAIWRDEKLDRRTSQGMVALAIAVAILVKSTAGAIPVAILVASAAVQRIPVGRVAAIVCVAGLAAAPWFLYQYQVNQRWFWSEFVEVELLAYGLGQPPQQTAESGVGFYARRLWGMDAWLCVGALAALPAAIGKFRTNGRGAVLVSWMLVMALALAGYRYRNATYLLPLIPALGLVVGERVRLHGPVGALLGGALLFGRLAWGGYYEPQNTLAGADLIERRCETGRTNDLIVTGIADGFYATVLPIARVRYAIPESELPPRGYSLDFRAMGVILGAGEYARMDEARGRYGPELARWGLPTADAIGAVIYYRDLSDLVRAGAGADILFPSASGEPKGVAGRVSRNGAGDVLVESEGSERTEAPKRGCRM
jgi:hypothetical protein